RPRFLHMFVIAIDVIRLVTEFPEIVCVKVWPTKHALHSSPHLFRVELPLQSQVLIVEPLQELRIIHGQDQESHNLSSTRDDSAWERNSPGVFDHKPLFMIP